MICRRVCRKVNAAVCFCDTAWLSPADGSFTNIHRCLLRRLVISLLFALCRLIRAGPVVIRPSASAWYSVFKHAAVFVFICFAHNP